MARWFGEWFGGASYASPDGQREVFASRAEAETALWERLNLDTVPLPFRYLDTATGEVRTVEARCPAVDATSQILLYASPDRAEDHYPSWRVSFGPRGGVHSERC